MRLVLGAALSMLAGACTFSEDRPGLGIPLAMRFDHDPKSASAATPSPPLAADWPKLFGSPELTRLGALTAQGNLDVAAAAARIEQADAQTAITASVLYPQLTGDPSTGRSFTPGTLRSRSGPFKTTATNSFQLGLTASYELDLWGRDKLATLAAADNAVATRFARDTLVLTSVASAVNSYFSLLSAQDRLKIAENNLHDAREALAAIKGRLDVGTVTALEVAEQQSVVDQQLASIPPMDQQLQQAKTAIALLAGRAPESLKIKGGSLATLKTPAIPAGVPSQLLLRRPDVAEAEATLTSGDASVQSARAALLPQVGLTASGGLESLALKTLLTPDAAFGSLAAGLTAPILDGGKLEGQLGLDRGLAREDLELYRKAVVQSLVDVENALIAVAQNTEHERLLADVVSSSKLAFDITQVRLREGTIDIVTVLNTEQTLFSAQDALAVARLARYTALSGLAQALGGGWIRPASIDLPPLRPLDPVPLEALAPSTIAGKDGRS